MKEEVIKEIAKKYHSLLRKHNFFPDYNQELMFYDSISKSCRDHKIWEKFILGVETSYFSLSYHLRRIIKHQYFYRNYSFWWEEFYTRRQYTLFKKEAIETFFDNLVKNKLIDKNGRINYVENM